MGKLFPGAVTRVRFTRERDDLLERLKAAAFRYHDWTEEERERVGWIGPRHLLDANIDASALEGWALEGRPVMVALRVDRKRVPAALVKAMVLHEADAHYTATGKRMKASEKRDAKESIEEQLARKSLPQPSAIPVLFDDWRKVAVVGTTSDGALERFFKATNLTIDDLVTPASFADEGRLMLATPSLFAGPGVAQADFGNVAWLGLEFLVWLWWQCETQGGEFPTEACIGGKVWMVIDAGAAFSAGSGAASAAVRGESPMRAEEARVALRRGKLPTSMRVSLTFGELNHSVTIDGRGWRFSGLKLAKDDPKKNADGSIDPPTPEYEVGWQVLDALDGILRGWCELRLSDGWAACREAIRAWVAGGDSVRVSSDVHPAESKADDLEVAADATDKVTAILASAAGIASPAELHAWVKEEKARRAGDAVYVEIKDGGATVTQYSDAARTQVLDPLPGDAADAATQEEIAELRTQLWKKHERYYPEHVLQELILQRKREARTGKRTAPMDSYEIGPGREVERDRIARLDERFSEVAARLDEKEREIAAHASQQGTEEASADASEEPEAADEGSRSVAKIETVTITHKGRSVTASLDDFKRAASGVRSRPRSRRKAEA